MHLSYVSEAQGAALRETVRAYDDQNEGTFGTVGAVPEKGWPEQQAIFAMGPKRLLTFGLFEFSLVIFAVLIGLAQQTQFLLPFDLSDLDDWQARFGSDGDEFATLNRSSQITGALFALGAIGVIGIATGVVRTVLRDWDFRLDLTPKGFRRRRGLFTRTDAVMPVHRVQALVISTKWLRKRFGWHRLSFISLAQDSGSANHDVAPFAQMDEIVPIAAAAGFTLPDYAGSPAAWQLPSARYYSDRAVLNACVFGGLAMIALLSVPGNSGLIAGLGLGRPGYISGDTAVLYVAI